MCMCVCVIRTHPIDLINIFFILFFYYINLKKKMKQLILLHDSCSQFTRFAGCVHNKGKKLIFFVICFFLWFDILVHTMYYIAYVPNRIYPVHYTRNFKFSFVLFLFFFLLIYSNMPMNQKIWSEMYQQVEPSLDTLCYLPEFKVSWQILVEKSLRINNLHSK